MRGVYASGIAFASIGAGVEGYTNSATNTGGLFRNANSAGPAIVVPSGEGRVGIGTTAPAYPLDINGSATGNTSGGPFFISTSVTNLNSGAATVGVSVRASGAFWSTGNAASGGFYVSSDQRIKRKLGVSNSKNDLAMLMKLKVTDYKYVDTLNSGRVQVKGVMAQEVESVYPQAISKQTNWIPNIYAMAESTSFDEANHRLHVTMSKAHGLVVGDKVKLISSTQGEKPVTVNAVNGNTFSISGWEEKSEKIFVYGKEVNDFRIVDYDRLFTLNVSATQELFKMITEQKQTIDDLKAKEEESKKKIAMLEASLSKVATGEAELNNLKSEIEKIKAALGISAEASIKKQDEDRQVKKEK